ncbi:MAG: hypothetical protein KAT70_02725 [Thermoplasmata archaeon]|nr:hypothetical protein [Thermoplasmata archaeon]
MERPPRAPPDPEEDWGEGVEKKFHLARWVTIGYVWGIIAMVIGALVLGAILFGWV